MRSFCRSAIVMGILFLLVGCTSSVTVGPNTPAPTRIAKESTSLPELEADTLTSMPPTDEPPSPSPGSTPLEPGVMPSPSIEAAEPTPTASDSDPSPSPPGAEAALSMNGPWLLFLASTSPEGLPYLWGVNSDGSGLGRVSQEPVLNFAVYPGRAPDGTILIAAVSSSPEELYRDLSLNLLTLPDGAPRRITDLTSKLTGLGPGGTTDEKLDIAVGISHYDGLSWSPDGRWLAFAGAMDGPSVDLYSYELASDTLRWLTDGPSHAYQFLWTAASDLIIHSARDYFLGAGGPYEVGEGVWGGYPDGSDIIFYEGAAPARFVGWQDESHLVIDSGPKNGCWTKARVLDLSSATTEGRGLECFDPIAYDAALQFALASVQGEDDPGDWKVKLVDLRSGESQTVSEDLPHRIAWDDHAQLFIMEGDSGLVGVTPEGELIEAPSFAAVPSPDGRYAVQYSLFAAGLGVWVSAGGGDPVKVLDDEARFLGWAPDSRSLYLVTPRDAFYLVTSPALEVIDLSETLWPWQRWVDPDNLWLATWAP